MRRVLNKDGKFIPLNPNAAKENVGFHWNALASMSWGKLAELYLRAKIAARKGDSSLLQQFYQKRLALERICRRLPTGNCVIRIQSRGILERGRRI